MNLGNLRRDESCHWYLIPIDKVAEHDDLAAKIDKAGEGSDEWYDLIGDYEVKFSKYMLGGGVGDLKVVIEE